MITQFGTKFFLDAFLGSDSYVGLSSTKPNVDGSNVTEPTATSYARQFLTAYGGGYDRYDRFDPIVYTDNGAKMETKETIYFAETYNNDTEEVEDWGELSYVCIFTAPTGGDLFAFQELPTPIHPGKDGQSSVALIRKGDLTIEIANPTPSET